MALTKTPIELSSTPSIVDGGNATAITIDSSENVAIGGSVSISHASGDSLTLTKTTTEPSLRLEGDTNKDFVITVSGELLTITQNDGGTNILTLDHDTKATTLANGLTLTDGNLVVASGHGIDFSATGNISGTSSELLDDYEEGTWTPILNGDGGATSGQSYGTVTAHYVKIGQLVYLGFDLALTTLGSIGGNYAVVNNLPFPALNSNLGGGSLGYYRHISNSTGPITFYVSASQAYLMKGGDTYVAKTDLTNSTRLIGFLSYRTSA